MTHNPYLLSTFNPSRRRYLSVKVMVMFAAYQLAYVILNTLQPGLPGMRVQPAVWLFYSFIFLAVYTAGLAFASRRMVEDLNIKISHGQIEGPSGDSHKRTRFTMEKLDRERTRKPRWYCRLLQMREIWSVDGEKIVLFTNAFEGKQVEAILKKIGCEC